MKSKKPALFVFDWAAFCLFTAAIPLALQGREWAVNLLLFQAWAVGLPCWLLILAGKDLDKNDKAGWGVPYWLSAVKALASALTMACLGYFVSGFVLLGLAAMQYKMEEQKTSENGA